MHLATVVGSVVKYLSASPTRLRLSLRTQLLLLVIAVLLPVLAFAAVMSFRHVQVQRTAIERGMKDTAQALSLALDREIGKLHAVLRHRRISIRKILNRSMLSYCEQLNIGRTLGLSCSIARGSKL